MPNSASFILGRATNNFLLTAKSNKFGSWLAGDRSWHHLSCQKKKKKHVSVPTNHISTDIKIIINLQHTTPNWETKCEMLLSLWMHLFYLTVDWNDAACFYASMQCSWCYYVAICGALLHFCSTLSYCIPSEFCSFFPLFRQRSKTRSCLWPHFPFVYSTVFYGQPFPIFCHIGITSTVL